jgi:hypothetical protein
MSRKKRWYIVTSVIVVTLLITIMYCNFPSRRINNVKLGPCYNNILMGMSVDEVELVLGRNHGQLHQDFAEISNPEDEMRSIRLRQKSLTWHGEDMTLRVWFDEATNRCVDKVTVAVVRIQPKQPTIINRIKAMLGF